jgi:hypothetical protein
MKRKDKLTAGKLAATAVAAGLILFPEPATTATGLAILAGTWGPGLVGRK